MSYKYLLLCLSQTLSLIAYRFAEFVIGVWIYTQTHSLEIYSAILFCSLFPGTVVNLFLGQIVDIFSKKKILIICNVTAILIIIYVVGLFNKGSLNYLICCILAIVFSILNSFLALAFLSSVTSFAMENHLLKANSFYQLGQSISHILSPLVAGFMLTTLGFQMAEYVNAIIYLISTLILLSIYFPKVPENESINNPQKFINKLSNLLSTNIHYYKSNSALKKLLFFSILINLISTFYIVLITPISLTYYDSTTLGFIFSLGGIGVITGSVLSTSMTNTKIQNKIISYTPFSLGLIIFCVGYYPNFYLLVLGSFLISAIVTISYIIIQTVYHKAVDSSIQGKIFGLKKACETLSICLGFIGSPLLVAYLIKPIMFQFLQEDVTATLEGCRIFYIMVGLSSSILGFLLVYYSYLNSTIVNFNKNAQ